MGKKTKKNVHEQVQEVEDEDEEVQDEENLNGGRNQSNLQRKLNMAADVIEGNSAPQRQWPPPPLAPPKHNPPVVIITDGTSIHVCKGCDKAITPNQKHYLHNMVFWHKAVTGYYNKVLNKYVHKLNNVHFPLTKQCLHGKDLSVQLWDIMMYEEVFEGLSHEQLQVLSDRGFLKYIMENIQNH